MVLVLLWLLVLQPPLACFGLLLGFSAAARFWVEMRRVPSASGHTKRHRLEMKRSTTNQPEP